MEGALVKEGEYTTTIYGMVSPVSSGNTRKLQCCVMLLTLVTGKQCH